MVSVMVSSPVSERARLDDVSPSITISSDDLFTVLGLPVADAVPCSTTFCSSITLAFITSTASDDKHRCSNSELHPTPNRDRTRMVRTRSTSPACRLSAAKGYERPDSRVCVTSACAQATSVESSGELKKSQE